MSESTQTPAPKVDAEGNVTLKRSMGPVQLWALAVGLVISGNFFGWSYGYAAGGPLGLLIACIPVTIFFATFILCYSEMATMLPSAGGGSIYARKAFGPFAGYCAGISSLVELMFAPPAIALAVGGYIHNLIPAIPAIPATIIVFIFFVMVNWLGMHTSAIFELIVTVVALVGLCIFWAAATPHFEMSNFLKPLAETNGFSGFLQYIPGGWKGILAATPYAIWFYLALEGGAVSAEEMNNPQKDIPKGFLTGMGTLFVMMCLTCVLTAGIADYTQVSAVDFPLPAALGIAYGEGSVITLVVNILGLFGLIASLNGIVAASSRQVYAMGRTGYLPKFFAGLNKKHRTPTAALWTAGIVGIITACTGLTNIVISISAFGLVFLYAISLCAYMERVVIKGGSEPEIIDGSAFENVFTESDSNDDLNVADTIEEGLLFINHDNKVVFRNKVAANIYSRLGFVEDITGQDYERISLAKRIEGELANVQEVRVGSYYFSVKMITINRQDVNYIVIISDITSEKLQEKELILKSVAFKEMHHRVKNNLQTIASLIRLQQNRTTNEETKRDLADTITRILAISSTHEMLLANDMETIKLNDMINTIKDNMLKYYGNDDFKLTIENYGGDFDIPFEKASALALILNELMQNSIKYAFVGKKKGKIVLMAIDGLGDDIKLIFEDNGCGFDAQTTTGGNMGWTIINSMVNEKLNGHVKLKSGDNGTRVEIVFPSKPL